VIVSTSEHSLLYDTGPGDGRGRDMVGSTVAPALDHLGSDVPDRVVVSHADLDHAGGLRSILDRHPGALYSANHPDQPGCTTPLQWQWQNVKFKTLHPGPALPYRGNDSSCVISVRSKGIGILLSGDISAVVEHRLLMEGLTQHPVLLVPHHGSLTSSSAAFIRRVQPRIAIATASLGNRFDFPREEIRQRYLDNGVEFWSSGECGALRLLLKSNGEVRAESARRQRNRIWRWPAADHCP
jgi:competence protein ComEC